MNDTFRTLLGALAVAGVMGAAAAARADQEDLRLFFEVKAFTAEVGRAFSRPHGRALLCRNIPSRQGNVSSYDRGYENRADLEQTSGDCIVDEEGFDGLQYIATHEDLILRFGANEAAGLRHWQRHGQAQGREADDFDEEQYLANYPDLQAAFGDDTDAATRHYIRTGYFEGRVDQGFEPLKYIATYEDLILALGADEAAGLRHWQTFGQAEGRVADDFDEEQYLANYPDLQAAFGDDSDASTVHYIEHGYFEGRTDEALPSASAASADFMI
jgi:hypothetical protein